MPAAPLILALAALPFIAKAATLGATGYLLQSLYKVLQLAAPLIWYRGNWKINAGKPAAKLLALGALISVAFSGIAILLITALLPLFHVDPSIIRAGMDVKFAVGPLGAVIVIVFLAIINSALEEWHFRWWLDRELSKRWGNAAGIVISALAFGIMHSFIFFGVPGIPFFVIALAACGIAVIGVVWSLLLRKPGGLFAAWLSHGLTDILLLGWGLWWLGYV